jgi:ribosomal protein L11 methyltransferase
MSWQQLTITIPSQQVELFETELLAHDALSITLTDAYDEPILEPAPGTTPLWSTTKLTALFTMEQDVLKIASLLQQLAPSQDLAPQIEQIADQAWERAWLAYFKPLHFGNQLWIVPTSYEPPEPHAVNIWLDPGLAFGTGTHPTTAMCLTWLAAHDIQHKKVIDYGCGSGILAIAAIKLGAEHVWAIDYDPQALTATLDNAQRNQLDLTKLSVGDNQSLPVDYQADILIANILTNALVQFAPLFARQVAPAGQIVLSGILHDQLALIETAFAPYFDLTTPTSQEDWICIHGIRKKIGLTQNDEISH